MEPARITRPRSPTGDALPASLRLATSVRVFHILGRKRGTHFVAARQERLKVSGNPSQYDDLDRFVREQELLRQLVRGSILPALTLDISDNDVPGAVERIADWLEATGGLWMNE